MITGRITKKGKKLESIKIAVKKIDKQKVEAGYFAGQGTHKGGYGLREYNYPALAQALELGIFSASGQQRKPMKFMKIIGDLTVKRMITNQKVKRGFLDWGSKLDKKAKPTRWMDAVGEFAIKQSQGVFNNTAYFPQASRNSTPLWETGDFAKHFTYRTSVDKNVRRT